MDVLQLLASDRNSFSAVACFEVFALNSKKKGVNCVNPLASSFNLKPEVIFF